MRKRGEIGERVTADVERRDNVQPCDVTRRVAGDIQLAVDVKRSLPTLPHDLHVIGNHFVFAVMELERFLRENPPRAAAKVPGQHDVALDEAHGQMVALLVVRAALTQEGQERNL